MTAFDRFDPFAGRVSTALDEIAPASRPAYLDEVLAQTAGTRQRPRWSFPGRWIPGWLTTSVPASIAGVPPRSLALLVLVVLLVLAAAAVWVGQQNRVPPPFGPADNGELVYNQDSDLYTRDTLAGQPRLLIGGPGDQNYPGVSPDGTRLVFSQIVDDKEYLWSARIDGSHPVQLLPDPIEDVYLSWGPDSRTIAIVTTIDSFPRLLLVQSDGSGSRQLLGPGDDVVPLDVIWHPPAGDHLLIRGRPGDGTFDLFTLNLDGSALHRLGLKSDLIFGPSWELTGATYSPDGSRIAYNVVATDRATQYDHFRTRVVNADGTDDREVPPPADPKVHEAWPIFSPDGSTILLHDWTWSWEGNEGWLSVMPADLSRPARQIGQRFPGGEKTGLLKAWSPDGARVLVFDQNSGHVQSIDPVTGVVDALDWAGSLPEWQRTVRH
jgi:hypothetical protein